MTNTTTATNSIDYQQRCELLEQQVAELNVKLKWFEEQLLLSKKRLYGASSEKTPAEQLQLFNEAEVEAQPLLAEPTLEKITYERRRKQPGHREAVLKDLPVETVEHRLPPSEQVCSCCGGALHEMSKETKRELKLIPAQVKVVEHVRYIYACRHCEQEGTGAPIVNAPMPAPVLKGSLASPSIMAFIMSQKYVEGLPLYRQEQYFSRLGIELPRQNLANWMIYGAERWLVPLYERLHEKLLAKDILHADETTLQVLHEPGRAAETKSYLWLYRTGQADPSIVLYDYQQTRGGEHPQKFLTGFKGYLHVDGYAGYHSVADVTLVGCWAHARRKFDEALKALPADMRSKPVAAKKGLEFCSQLYKIERDLKKGSPKERYEARQKSSQPVLEAFLAWLNEQAAQALPKSTLGEAVTYCLNQWDKLTAYLKDGRLEIDNNLSERAIKPFVIGRKNWLFANTPRGARTSAVIYSIVETAKENGLNPFAYLQYLFERLPNIDVKDPKAIDDLLPYSASLPRSCRVATK